MKYSIGTAAWTVPKEFAEYFKQEGSHLERYAGTLNAVEINSSFYKDHQAKTYSRWYETTPPYFKFSVKLAKEITHTAKLAVSASVIREKLTAINELKEKLSVLLIQIPPSLKFDPDVAEDFFSELRYATEIPVAFEPRHASWLSTEAKLLLQKNQISKVIADPPVCNPTDPENFLNGDLVYFRLHGSPEIYKSPYEKSQLAKIQLDLQNYRRNYSNVWCIFDNTTFGFATANAVELSKKLNSTEPTPRPYFLC